MSSKSCSRCGEEKALGAFYKHPKTADGLFTHCKECHKLLVKENRDKKIDHYREYDRARANKEHRIEVLKKSAAKYQANNPDKNRARQAVARAIKSGALSPWPACAVPTCDCTAGLEGHHSDYSNHLGVTWLCQTHHKQVHKEHRAYLREQQKVQHGQTA